MFGVPTLILKMNLIRRQNIQPVLNKQKIQSCNIINCSQLSKCILIMVSMGKRPYYMKFSRHVNFANFTIKKSLYFDQYNLDMSSLRIASLSGGQVPRMSTGFHWRPTSPQTEYRSHGWQSPQRTQHTGKQWKIGGKRRGTKTSALKQCNPATKLQNVCYNIIM